MTASADPEEIEDVLVLKATEKSMYVRSETGYEAWIARSLTLEGTTIHDEGDVGTLVLPQWLAAKEKFI